MPLPVKSICLRGGMSIPTGTAPDAESVSCGGFNASDNSLQRGRDVNPNDNTSSFLRCGARMDETSRHRWNPRHSMAFNSAKGLLNPVGENNCFLNCAVQVLWHLDVFRRNFRLLSGHACLGSSCIFCALKAVFTQYQFSERSALPADSLRRALAHSFAGQQRFQMGFMDDASECFENILLRIHHHLAPDQSDDNCQAPHCLPHRKFTMRVKEQIVCECPSTSGDLTFDQMVHYIATTSLMRQVQRFHAVRIGGGTVPFGRLLKEAKSDGEARKCSSGCGRLAAIHRTLTNIPEVISIGFIWNSERPSFEHIRGVVNAISTELQPQDLFDVVFDSDASTFQLVGVVCFYSRHYSTFFFHSKMKTWVLFDDANIIEVGPNWRSVADRCCQGHYQPLLLLYSKTNNSPINFTTALRTTIVHSKSKPDHHRNHPCMPSDSPLFPERSYQGHIMNQFDGNQHCLKSDMNSAHINDSTSTLSSCSSDSVGYGKREAMLGKHNNDAGFEWSSSANSRQPSYLFAITGKNSVYRDNAYSSYVTALGDAASVSRSVNCADRTGMQSSSLSLNQTQHQGQGKQETNPSTLYGAQGAATNSLQNGFLPDEEIKSFKVVDSRCESRRREPVDEARYSSFPRASYGQRVGLASHANVCPNRILLSESWTSRTGGAPIRRPPPDVGNRTEVYSALSGSEQCNAVNGCHVRNWRERTDVDDSTIEGQYISAKKVQNVLMSQGVKTGRIGASRNPSTASSGFRKTNGAGCAQNAHLTYNGSSKPKVDIAGVYASRYLLLSDSLENVSLGSHKDSGYRSGDSNPDQSSPNSVPSSPSLDSGEFLPARNARLIAQGFMKPEREDSCEMVAFHS